MPSIQYPVWIYLIGLWSLLWKGIALWRCANDKQKIWFMAILVLNTLGIVEIIYLFKFAKKKLTLEEIKTWPKLFNLKKKS
jgi:hypothetical protein